MKKTKPIADMKDGVAPESIFLHSSGRLYSADGPVSKRLRSLFWAWNRHLKIRGQPALKGAQPVCIVHRQHLQALWDQAAVFAHIPPEIVRAARYKVTQSRIIAKLAGQSPYTHEQLKKCGMKCGTKAAVKGGKPRAGHQA